MSAKSFLAIDMGASGGRHILGKFDGKRISLEEIYRFENGPIALADTLFWNAIGLWQHVQKGMSLASQHSCCSVGVDTWGVDFALLGHNDVLLGNPVSYRDTRTDGFPAKAFSQATKQQIFEQTGLQFMQFNTLYQFLAMRNARSPILDAAKSFLMMPDFFHWLLSGVKCNETTNASTTQFYNPLTKNWAFPLLEQFQLPSELFRSVPLVAPGTELGTLRKSVAKETGLASTKVIAPCTHDTASAILAVPTSSPLGTPNWAYISLGTWALMGFESPKPIVNDTVLGLNFTNEGGVGGTTRVLKNICGLWLIQECRRVWTGQGKKNISGSPWDWEDLSRMSAAEKPLVSFINPDASEFLNPSDMPEAIRQFCKKTNQIVPQTEGAILRCAIESIALKCRQTLSMCEEISGNSLETIHIVGGGTRHLQMCQAISDACGKRVVTGPIEATAIGNLMMQAVAAGDVKNINEARQIVKNSVDIVELTPQREYASAWHDAAFRFAKVI